MSFRLIPARRCFLLDFARGICKYKLIAQCDRGAFWYSSASDIRDRGRKDLFA